MLNVQQVRLRFISARLLASAPPIFKRGGAIFASTSVFKMTASLLSSYDVSEYQYRHGGRWFCTKSSSQSELAAQKCTRMYIFERGGRWFHAVAMFLHNKNSPSTNVHGCTFVDHPLKKLFIPMNVLAAIKIYQGFRLKFYSHSAECHLLYHFLYLQSISFSHDF